MNKNLKTLFSSASNEWGTPQDLFNELDSEFNFTLDPCATKQNHKCKKYFTQADDGLSKSWAGHTVFMNPPYGREVGKWIKKAYNESKKQNTVVVCLIPARTDTKYFHDYCKHGELRFLKGRLKFDDGSGRNGNATFPSVIVIFGGSKWGVSFIEM